MNEVSENVTNSAAISFINSTKYVWRQKRSCGKSTLPHLPVDPAQAFAFLRRGGAELLAVDDPEQAVPFVVERAHP